MIFPVLVVLFLLFSLVPTGYELSRAGDLRPEREFELVHNFYTDYNFYLSRIREGLSGRLTVVEKYTTEQHRGSFIHEMYLLMGSVGRVMHVPPGRAGDVYHTARAVLGLALLGCIAWFSRRSWPMSERWRVIAFLFAVTASSWPKLVYVDGMARFGGYMPWWSVMDSLQRITFIPHLVAGQALMLCIVGALTSSLWLRRSGNVMVVGLTAFALGMIFPPGLVFVFGTVGVYGVIEAVWEHRLRWTWWQTWGGIVLIGSSALVYLMLMTSIYPWHRLAELDILHPLPFDYWEYVKAMGPVLPIGLAGALIALYRREQAMLPSVSWVIAWIGFLVIFRFVPQQSPLRFSEMIPHVPLGILSAYALYRMDHVPRFRFAAGIVPVVLIGLGLLQMYSSWLWQRDFVDHKIRASVPLVPTGSYVMYPLKDFYAALLYLESHTQPSDIVLSEMTAGNYIPVYSGNTVYIGHDNTVNAEAKKAIVTRFFSGRMTVSEARTWLMQERIRMIFFGPQEREVAGGTLLTDYYPFLTSVYANTMVRVYTPR